MARPNQLQPTGPNAPQGLPAQSQPSFAVQRSATNDELSTGLPTTHVTQQVTLLEKISPTPETYP
ncbi:hypothetical protein K435DRAFT_874360 [Dendrothele bispora CBS 962.96]|uniref:Uncharacterized protein n=1 Tax=Dendrothele bispora (strain CBS 962.96) TaxID=1314807 RepID=A0A4S8KWV2_DENBC|nr:hypothetical protein K435DRAFT_874360 [Dendrothele bispora CBS 962.96]